MFASKTLTVMGLMGAAALTLGSLASPASASSSPSSSAPGVTAKSITVGQVDDLTAPLPGLFKSAEAGTQAYFNYVNSMGGVNGRRIILDARDSAFNTATVVSATRAQAQNDFALVGGFSLLDQAEIPVINSSKVPDVASPISPALGNNSNVYSPSPELSNAWPVGHLKWFKQKYPQAVKHVAILYDAQSPGAEAVQHNVDAALRSQGYKIVYERGISAIDTSFLSDVLKMKAAGVQMIYETELPAQQAAPLAQALQQQDLKVVNIELIAYAANLAQLAGSAGNGIYFPEPNSLYQGEDAKVIPAVATMDKWILKVYPGVFSSTESISALYGWTSAQLFVQALKAAGPNPTRASLVTQLNKITNFTANNLLAPGNPAKNIPPTCWILAQLNNGKIARVSPTPKAAYICNPGGSYAAAGWKPQSR